MRHTRANFFPTFSVLNIEIIFHKNILKLSSRTLVITCVKGKTCFGVGQISFRYTKVLTDITTDQKGFLHQSAYGKKATT